MCLNLRQNKKITWGYSFLDMRLQPWIDFSFEERGEGELDWNGMLNVSHKLYLVV